MNSKKNKEKRKKYNYILKYRGGFSPVKPVRIPKYLTDPLQKELSKVVKENTSPERISRFVSNLIEAASRGKAPLATKILKELSKPLSVKVGKKIQELVDAPLEGLSSPEGVPIPLSSSLATRRVSGRNQLYFANEYNVNFKAGNPSGTWMRQIAKTNGTSSVKVYDTTEAYHLDDEGRDNLSLSCGANQKLQFIVEPAYFGFTSQEVAPYFDLAALDSSKLREQAAYGALSHLTSKMTLTSINKYTPMYVRVSLISNKLVAATPYTAWSQCVNQDPVTPAQDNGAMPVTLQQSLVGSNSVVTWVNVDPGSTGIRSADNFQANFDIITSKTVKLSAGDHVNVNYVHEFGSGIRLDKLYSTVKESTNYSTKNLITYGLMVEIWGIEVDAYLVETPTRVIKCTSPCAFQMEFSKYRRGVRPLLASSEQQNTLSFHGWLSDEFAVKVYTKSPVYSLKKRWFDTYANLNTVYKVPVMSDATEQDAGKTT